MSLLSELFAQRYFLCQQNNFIGGYTCQEFDSFVEADQCPNTNGQPTIILYHSKWLPRFLDETLLSCDLSRYSRCKIGNI